MSLTLTVDGARWRQHLQGVAAAHPGLVPVAKGNGYGFTIGRLARKTRWLHDHVPGVDTLAVGTYPELAEASSRFDGDLLVLTPWRPFQPSPDPDVNRRVIHTVSRPQDLLDLLAINPTSRFVFEQLTSMRRHGLTAKELRAAAWLAREQGVRPEGLAIHLPLSQGSHLTEARRLINAAVGAEVDSQTIWISHLTLQELALLRAEYPDFTIRPRIGTTLWLGDRQALRVTATVLDVHAVERGDPFGYRGRSAPKAGHILVVSGGTAHGIGLAAPTGDQSIRSRAASLARGGLDAAGFVRSPFAIDGKLRLFAEPPHMQASMLFLPLGARVPSVGDQVDVRVRYTATTFDNIVVR